MHGTLRLFPVFNSPIAWNMCENLHYESAYFKELHKEQEYRGGCSVNYYWWYIVYGVAFAIIKKLLPYKWVSVGLLKTPSQNSKEISVLQGSKLNKYLPFAGLPRCKKLWRFSLFSSYYFPWLYCVDFSVASLYSLFYDSREFHRFGFYFG